MIEDYQDGFDNAMIVNHYGFAPVLTVDPCLVASHAWLTAYLM